MLSILCFSLLLAGLDLTVLHVAVPSLARDLDTGGSTLLWIVDVYSLVVAALLIVSGSLADRFGRKRIALTGFTVFGLGSLAASFATSAAQLIAARALLGVGTALFMAATVAIIRNVFTDDRERGIAIGLWTASHSVGTTLGPLIGGLLVEHFRWGVVFLINVPIVVVVTLVGLVVIPESHNPDPRRWDPLSVVLSVVGLGGFAYGLKQAASPDSVTPLAVVGGVAGVAVLVWFVVRQRRIAHPLLDLTLFRNRRFSVAVLAVFACFGSYVAMLFLLMQWLQQARQLTPLAAGLAIVPLAVANALGATLAPYLTARLGQRVAMTAALAAFGASLAFFALSPAVTGYVVLSAVLVVSGFGAGVIMTAGADAITSAVEPDRAGEAAAIQETSFELSAGIGVAVLGSVVAVGYRLALPATPFLSAEDSDSAGASIAAAEELALRLQDGRGESLLSVATEAYDQATRVASGVAAAVLFGVAALTAVLLRHSTPEEAKTTTTKP